MAVPIILAGLIAACAVVAPQQANRKEGIALLERAQKLHAEGKYSEAIAEYDRATTKLPQIADWISMFAASSASFLGDTAQVARRLTGVDADMAAWAWRARARAYMKAGATARAAQVARAATRSGRVSTQSDAWYMLADIGVALSAEERAEAGRAHMRNGDIAVGMRALERALASGELNPAAAAEVRYDLGRVSFSVGKYAQAITYLERVPRDHARGGDARFLLARASYRNGEQERGSRIFRSIVQEYPGSPVAARALYFLGDLAQDDGNTSEALRYFQEAANAQIKADESGLAMMRAAGILYSRKDYGSAYRTYEAYRARYPNGAYSGQATYWAAQSAAKIGNASKANELYRLLNDSQPISYYGMRASYQLGDSALIAGLPAGPGSDAATVKTVKTGLDRWELLRDVAWNEAAAHELSRQKSRFNGDNSALYVIAEELQERAAPHLAITTGRELLSSGAEWDARLLRIMYPMPYEQLIKRESRAHGLDPHFVAALIRQESRFNKEARSGAGAIGLMQVMPATGKQLARKAGIKRVTPETLTDPGVNVKLGTRFLADMLRTYRRADLALVAYNAGPTRASRWRSFPEFSTPELFVERIPFEETRDYVKIIMLNTAIYKALYPSTISAN